MRKIVLLVALCLGIGNAFAQDVDKLRDEGDAALKAKNYTEAVAKYSEYFKLNEYKDTVRIFNCGFSANQAKQYAEAAKFFDMAVKYKYNLDDSYVNGFIKQLTKSNDKILKKIYIDMIHKNCFVQENGDYIWIDQEWCLDDIPASFGLYYNIIELYSADSTMDTYIPMKLVLEHYSLTDKCECYYNLKQLFLNTVQNKYSAFNYRHLSELNKDNITTNIKLLYNNMNNCPKQHLSETEARINEILKNGTIMDVIEYVGTLTDEIILKDIPQMPQFIVRYLKANDNEKAVMQQSIKRYDDIKNM